MTASEIAMPPIMPPMTSGNIAAVRPVPRGSLAAGNDVGDGDGDVRRRGPPAADAAAPPCAFTCASSALAMPVSS
jgi:hypothetical protein